jgi:hypothetical protein
MKDGRARASNFRALQRESVGAEFSVLQELLDPLIKSSAICYKVLLDALGLDGGLEVGVE